MQNGYSQKFGFISSATIRQQFLEYKQADQRVQTMVEEWKREMDGLQKEIDALDFEINKNRLVWSDNEKLEKTKELENKRQQRLGYAKSKFEPNGEYDAIVKQIMKPIETKIYAAVQEVASEEGLDMILDQSIQAVPYLNYKYDMTVKVLRKLGVDVDQLEKELKEKIDKDPRNKKTPSVAPRTKSRIKGNSPDQREVEREDNDNKPDGSNTIIKENPNSQDSTNRKPVLPNSPTRPPR